MTAPDRMLNDAIRLHEAGRIAEASDLYRKLLAQQPSNADALHLLGVAEHQSGRRDAAMKLIGRAVQIKPQVAMFWSNLAEVQRSADRLPDAEQSLRRAIALSPQMAVAHNNLGLVLDDLNRTEDARREYESAIALESRYLDPYVNLAKHYGRSGDLDRAAGAARAALQLDPNSWDALLVAGNALATGGDLTAAIEMLEKALAMKADANVAWLLSNALRERGDHAACIAVQRRAVSLDPDNQGPAAKLLYDLHYAPDQSPESIAEEHFAWARRYADPIARLPGVHVHASYARMRIGYVSADFRRHAVGQFLRPVLRAHSREALEIYCYANNKPDAVTPEFEALANHWRDIRELSDDDAAALIHRDEIDVLVDLSGHTQGSRPLLLARKPAAVQATYLGYPDTTGMSAIDYRITDADSDPPGMTEAYQRERLARVSTPFLVYEPHADAPAISASPLERNGFVTFGSFNRPSKIAAPAIAAWAKILAAVPRSRLMIKGFGIDEERTRQIWRQRFADAGIDGQRVNLLGLTFHAADHLKTVASIDIALDTFPYNGTATTCDAMWMGVPVVALAGRAHVSRVGVSLLSSVGLGELVAADQEEYVRTAIELANNATRLRDLRRGMRDRMACSPLMDAKRLARDIESFFRDWSSEASASL